MQQVAAQATVKMDSTALEIRHFSDEHMRAYRGQREFDYQRDEVKGKNLWERFWAWFWEQVFRMSEKQGVRKGFEVFIWIFAISLVLFAIYKLTGMEKRFFLLKGTEGNLDFREGGEDIHGIDFANAIGQAVDQKNYRLAIRLMYLRNLKKLADRQLISYRIDKTNLEYATELSSTPYAAGFRSMTRVFEYAWYGEFPVDHELFEKLAPIFEEPVKSVSA